MALGDKITDEADADIDGATIARMLDLAGVLKLINYRFDVRSFAQKMMV